MVWRVFLLLLLGSLGPLPAMAQQTFLPTLDRAEAQGWPAIGRVRRASILKLGFCSGALIAPRVVLTAAHCAGGTAPSDPAKQDSFLAGVWDGDLPAERRIIARMPHPDYRGGDGHDPAHDVGLLILDHRVTDIAPLPLAPPGTPIKAQSLALLGYHSFSRFRLAGRLDCPPLPYPGAVLRLGCAVVSGNSGSPVLVQDTAGNWQITAVVSSRFGDTSLARPLSGWVHDTLARWSAPSATPDRPEPH